MTIDLDKAGMDDLERLFEQARANPPSVSDRLLQRVLADAAAGTAPQQPRWLAVLGGLPMLGGLVSASLVGIWLGAAPPAAVPDLAGQLFQTAGLFDDLENDDAMLDFGWSAEISTMGQNDG